MVLDLGLTRDKHTIMPVFQKTIKHFKKHKHIREPRRLSRFFRTETSQFHWVHSLRVSSFLFHAATEPGRSQWAPHCGDDCPFFELSRPRGTTCLWLVVNGDC